MCVCIYVYVYTYVLTYTQLMHMCTHTYPEYEGPSWWSPTFKSLQISVEVARLSSAIEKPVQYIFDMTHCMCVMTHSCWCVWHDWLLLITCVWHDSLVSSAIETQVQHICKMAHYICAMTHSCWYVWHDWLLLIICVWHDSLVSTAICMKLWMSHTYESWMSHGTRMKS